MEEKGKKLFLLQRELGVDGGLKVCSCRTEGILKGSEEFDWRGAVERGISGVK